MMWLIGRYMDDLRTMLAPVKRGWRATPRGLTFCQKWLEEDSDLTPTEVTKRVLCTSLNMVEEFLQFTMETPEDEGFKG